MKKKDITGLVGSSKENMSIVTITVGEYVTYHYTCHSSVGYESEFDLDNTNSIRLKKNDFQYRHPARVKAGMCGADEAYGTYHFEAVEKGATVIVFRRLFRGTIEREEYITINVI